MSVATHDSPSLDSPKKPLYYYDSKPARPLRKHAKIGGFLFYRLAMIYSKSALSYAAQADLLLSRGLIADQALLVKRLKSVNYYRLSGYLHTYRETTADGQRLDSFRPGTDFTTVWQRYVFDRQLRLLVLDGIERVEIMSYGSVLTLFHGMVDSERKQVATEFGLRLPHLDSWITTLNYIRNICAHHGRLWNRELGVKPKIPFVDTYPDWHIPVPTPADRIFSVLTILHYFSACIAPQSQWPDRVVKLFSEYSEIPFDFMGFPPDWKNHVVWNLHV